MRRRLSAILAAAVALLAAFAPVAHAGGANNVVLVSTTGDGSSAARSSLQAVPFGGDSLTSANIASATSHDCNGCRTVAVAVQAVFSTHDPSSSGPANVAVATNANCTSCETFAYAFQYSITTPGPVHLSPTGQQEISQLREEIADTAASGLPLDQLDARLHELSDEFRADIDNELQAAGNPGAGKARQQVSVDRGS